MIPHKIQCRCLLKLSQLGRFASAGNLFEIAGQSSPHHHKVHLDEIIFFTLGGSKSVNTCGPAQDGASTLGSNHSRSTFALWMTLRKGLAALILCASPFLAAKEKPVLSASVYSCSAKLPKHASSLNSTTRFDGQKAGWDLDASPASANGGACSSARPFFFSFPTKDATYQVTVELGGPVASVTTVKAESRKLMLLNESTAANETRSFTFNVPVRTPFISGSSEQVKLKQREIGGLSWDDKLTLEFNGTNPSVRTISIRTVSVPTIYIAGDSTVVDQAKEPWTAWGQILPVFFSKGIAVSNIAESGETIRSFTNENRFAKIFSTIRAGDFLFIQFAHNDQKPGSGFVSISDYKNFLRTYIMEARAKGATPIFVTSMNRRTFNSTGQIQPSLGEYPQAMRDVAAEKSVALIDLNILSKTFYEALGPDQSVKAFVHYPANSFPDQPEELKDDTHFNAYGAYELARIIVSQIQSMHLPLASYLRKGIPPFDPAHPDPLSAFYLPASPFVSSTTPYER
jgi:lysophospholipase L1-like esterase